MFGHPLDLGLLARADRYFEPVLIERPSVGDGLSLEIHNRWEVGFTTGPTERVRDPTKLFTVPRLGVAYRFGEGSTGVSILLRMRN
jgi:hypothetical protein